MKENLRIMLGFRILGHITIPYVRFEPATPRSQVKHFTTEPLHSSLHCLLTHNASIAIKVVCFSCLLKCLRSLYGKQCGPRSDCSYRSSLISGSTVFASTLKFVSNVKQLFAADDFSRQHFQMHFFLAL